MKILLTGANGYIGVRLLAVLAEAGHTVVALARSPRRVHVPRHLRDKVQLMEGDLLKKETLQAVPKEIDVAYYLVHSMGQSAEGFSDLEAQCAENFIEALNSTAAQQVIYLSGLSRPCSSEQLSEHMASRHHVEDILKRGKASLTVLRAGIIIGSGSASFEIIRDLVEKLPVMIGPKWVYSRCQPIAIRDVLFYLQAVMGHEKCLGETFEIGSEQQMTYKEMLLKFAEVRGLKRWIISVPLLTPYLSSLWLFMITSTNFSLARALVNSLKTDAICTENKIQEVIPHLCVDYTTAVHLAFEKIEQNAVLSSWKDAMVQSALKPILLEYMEVPRYGCMKEVHTQTEKIPKEEVLDRIWSIGGDNGWYHMDWAWALRGLLDRMVGGVGLRRGRTHPTRLVNGDALDFWRVVVADRQTGHLLLYAEMKTPGDAWLEWHVESDGEYTTLKQTATFRPKGLLGRLYWYSLVPAHFFIFRSMCSKILKGEKK